MGAEENLEAIKRAVQAVNERNMSAIMEVIAPDFKKYDLTRALPDVSGQHGMTDLLQLVLRALPDLHVDIDDIFSTESRLAVHLSYSGTHQGEFFGAAPTGKPVTFNGINLYHLKDGKVTENKQLMDVAGFLRQVGALNL
jgi:steroid delta-isomerase-like uncharacterized protein